MKLSWSLSWRSVDSSLVSSARSTFFNLGRLLLFSIELRVSRLSIMERSRSLCREIVVANLCCLSAVSSGLSISSAYMLMEVRGVLSSWETRATKLVFFSASRCFLLLICMMSMPLASARVRLITIRI